jgi:hypothetical protein
MNVGLVFRHLGKHPRSEGATGTLRWLVRRAQWRWREWRSEIRTEAIIEMDELGIDNSEAGEYQPTDYTDFPKIMRALALEPSEHVFVDYGAGMGRVMILAAAFPFRRVIGIEHSDVLAKIARDNIQKCHDKLECRAIEIVNEDAASYALPEEASVFYFNNPFRGRSLEKVLVKIHSLGAGAMRPVFLVCNLPSRSQFEEQLRRHDWLELKEYLPLNDFRHCLIFRTRPARPRT